MPSPLLELLEVSQTINNGDILFDDINLKVYEGDIVVLHGKSGTGKSTLLKCIAHLVAHQGHILYRGKTPTQVGVPLFRTRVLYVPQRPSLLPGSPSDFLRTILSLNTHQAHLRSAGDDFDNVLARATDIAGRWGVDDKLWDRGWSNLSGGEAQRLLLAAAISLDTAEILLLDEPTSALDSETALRVEEFLTNRVNSELTNLRALVWITHSPEQGRRIGTRFVQFSGGTCAEDSPTSSISV